MKALLLTLLLSGSVSAADGCSEYLENSKLAEVQAALYNARMDALDARERGDVEALINADAEATRLREVSFILRGIEMDAFVECMGDNL